MFAAPLLESGVTFGLAGGPFKAFAFLDGDEDDEEDDFRDFPLLDFCLARAVAKVTNTEELT